MKWENTTNEEVLQRARDEIWQSWRRACTENADHPRAEELFDPHVLPYFHDPFAGGGAIPLEAQRLGLNSHASDLNPVAVLINKAKIEIPPTFADAPPVNPQARSETRLMSRAWHGAEGLMADVRYYGKWMRDQAEKRIGNLYPMIYVSEEMAKQRPALAPYTGLTLTPKAWLWTRTVKSPNPALVDVHVPLATTFILSDRSGKEAYIEPQIEGPTYHFTIRTGTPPKHFRSGTKVGGRAHFRCLLSDTPIPGDYIKAEGQAGRMNVRLMAIVADGNRERIFLPPTPEHEAAALRAMPKWVPNVQLVGKCRDQLPLYGMNTFADAFSSRQLVALTTFSELASEARQRVQLDAAECGLVDDSMPLRDGGRGATAYAEAIAVYLGLALSKLTDYSNSLCTWNSANQNISHMFTGHAIPMTWNYAEASPLHYGLSFASIAEIVARSLEKLPTECELGKSYQADSTSEASLNIRPVIQTDPPYFDNISFADLSDFFYVWLRPLLQDVYPDLFATLTVPKTEELVGTVYRHGSRKIAETFFVDGMTRALSIVSRQSHTIFPIIIYYAFKQSEGSASGARRTGWETFLDAAIRANLSISGTWPLRTERGARAVAIGANALASSIVLVCRPRAENAPSATRREFQEELRIEFPKALAHLQRMNIAPVDLAQASIGPGMAVFTRYSKVLNADGSEMSVGIALGLINSTLDEVLAEQEGDFDPDTRWALTWFEQHGYTDGEFGVAEQLSKAKNTSVDGLARAGIIKSRRGKVRILKPAELDPEWDPSTDSRLTVWELTQHLIRLLESGGEPAAGELAVKLGSQAEAARDLAYRLYLVSERKRRAADALQYNSLVQSWPEIARMARQRPRPRQTVMLSQAEDGP